MDVDTTAAVLDMIDKLIGRENPAQAARRAAEDDHHRHTALGLAPWQGRGIATKGCTKKGCPGTMWRTHERTGGTQWVCKKCGHVE